MPRGVYERKRRPISERFWAKVLVGSPEDCWTWTAAQREGYGIFMIASADRVQDLVGAHVFSFYMATGRWPAGDVVRHRCHIRTCVNPAHLREGSYADNSRDMVEAGRSSFGERRYNHKLTWAAVAAARTAHAAGESACGLARAYGVSERTMRQCLSGETWRAAA